VTQKEFEKKWISLIEHEFLKKFPDEFIGLSETESVDLPNITLMFGSEFFGNYELVDSNGNVHFNVDNYYKAKFILYANRLKPGTILMPLKQDKLISAVKEYERLLDSILKRMERDFKQDFPVSHNFPSVSNHVFNTLNLYRY
jgi:hypothetical protein